MGEELQACLDRRPDAWEAFVRRYGPLIHGTARRVLANRTRQDVHLLTEDVVQEVFLRLVKDDLALLRTFDPSRASLSTWLTIVTRSTTIDVLRRRSLPTVPLSEALADQLPGRSAPLDAPDPVAIPPGLLSPRQTLVLHLLFDREMGVAQASQFLGVDAQTVRSMKHKALEKLRLHFGKQNRP